MTKTSLGFTYQQTFGSADSATGLCWAALANEITQDGGLLEWHFTIAASFLGALVIWRKQAASQNIYEIVYFKSYDLSNGYHILKVTDGKFSLQNGDLLGFGAGADNKGSIGWSNGSPTYVFIKNCAIAIGTTLNVDISANKRNRNYAFGAVYGTLN